MHAAPQPSAHLLVTPLTARLPAKELDSPELLGSGRVERGIRCHHVCVKRSKHQGERESALSWLQLFAPSPSVLNKKLTSNTAASFTHVKDRKLEGGKRKKVAMAGEKQNRKGDLLTGILLSLLIYVLTRKDFNKIRQSIATKCSVGDSE